MVVGCHAHALVLLRNLLRRNASEDLVHLLRCLEVSDTGTLGDSEVRS